VNDRHKLQACASKRVIFRTFLGANAFAHLTAPTLVKRALSSVNGRHKLQASASKRVIFRTFLGANALLTLRLLLSKKSFKLCEW